MKTHFKNSFPNVARKTAAILVLFFCVLTVRAASVSETRSEFFGVGDFDGNNFADILVLDKATGIARVGYQDSSGNLIWSPPMPTGVENVSGCAIGRFLQNNRDDLVLAALDFNSVPIISLASQNAATTSYSLTPVGIGAHTLIDLPAPTLPPPSRDSLLIATALNNAPAEQLELTGFLPGPIISTTGIYSETGFFERGNTLQLATNGPTFAVGMTRGNTNDALHIWQFTNSPNVMVALSNLPPGSDYVFGKFDGEALPRFWFYTPGQSNIAIRPLVANGSSYGFGTAISLNFTQAVQRVFYVAQTNDGSMFIQFGDGIQGVKIRNGTAQFAPKYTAGAGASGNAFTGIADLNNGRFVLFSAPTGTVNSLQAKVMSFDGTNYTQISSNNLQSLTTRNTRSTVWLFQSEPFTNTAAKLTGSINAPDWSSGIVSLSGSVSVRVENDAGASSGLGNAKTNSFGATPSGTTYALPNQYRSDISFFSYTPPRAPEQYPITISPAPGKYGGPVQISFTKTNILTVYYRLDSADTWRTYSSPFLLTNDSTIQYYGKLSTGARGRMQLASYTVGHEKFSPESPVNVPGTGGDTNQSPVILPGTLISASGTIFYSRADYTIWTINLDGSGDQRVTDGYLPRVSPDGRYLLFVQPANGLWMRELSTGIETQLDPQYYGISGYDWERDSARFVMDRSCNILSRDIAGNSTILPTNDCNDDAPVVNPANGSIAFHNLNPNKPTVQGIYVMPPARTSQARVNLNLINPLWPAWSPDGQQLAVTAGNPNQQIESANNLWLFNSDGTNLRQITALGSNDGFPFGAIWAPDGKALITAGTIWGTNGLWVLHLGADGQYCGCAPVRLPTTPGAAIQVAGSVVVPPNFIPDAKPGLFIREEPSAVVVYWSTNYSGYILQSATNLTSLDWSTISGPYFLNGGYYEYREAKTALETRKFFRLKSPGVLILTPDPKLSMRVESNQAVVNWPLNYVGYTLESTTNLAPPIFWTAVNGVASTNGAFEARKSLPGKSTEFFRLRR